MKFIRALWGDLEHHDSKPRKEIIRCSKEQRFDEVVFVWGESNYDFIKSFGYEAILMSKDPYEYGTHYFYESHTFFLHKLVAIKTGVELYEQIIFLDWDIYQQKPLDLNFYSKLEEQNSKLQIPLYCFPNNYEEYVLKEWKDISREDVKYLHKHQSVLQKYNWQWANNVVVPNTSFVYCSDLSIAEEFIRINQEEDIEIVSDETPVMHYFLNQGTTLEAYIKKYEPLVSNAKFETHFKQKDLNDYIKLFISKDLYFIHE